MLLDIIAEIQNALDNNMYLAALSLALMVPDICGKAEYPDKRVGERYKDWIVRKALEKALKNGSFGG